MSLNVNLIANCYVCRPVCVSVCACNVIRRALCVYVCVCVLFYGLQFSYRQTNRFSLVAPNCNRRRVGVAFVVAVATSVAADGGF